MNLRMITSMVIEVTTECPLHCPFCYCLSNKAEHLSLDKALYWIQDAQSHGVNTIGFSGGEVLCYPYLTDVIRAAHTTTCSVAIATSGYGLTQEKLRSLLEAGLDGIHISLNGSTEEINRLSRNGYIYAVRALQLLYDNQFFASCINFVLTRDNARDITQMIRLAEQYRVGCLSILCLKPDSEKEISLRPTAEQMEYCAEVIDNYTGKLNIQIESCYPELIWLLKSEQKKKEYLHPLSRICRAGVSSLSVNVNGELQPCRHINLPEKWSSIQEYLMCSPVIRHLSQLSEEEPNGCQSCEYADMCRPCLAIRIDTQGSFDACQPCPLAH